MMTGIAILLSILLAFSVIFLILLKNRKRILISLLSGCITGVITFYLANNHLIPFLETKFLQYKINQSPIMTTLATVEPERFNQYLQDIHTMLYHGKEPSTALIVAYQLIHELFPKYLTHASDDSIVIYIRTTLDLYQKLQKNNPAYVVYTEFPYSAGSKNILPILNHYDGYIKNRQYAIYLVIDSAIHQHQNPHTEYGPEGLAQIIQTLSEQYGTETVIKAITDPTNTSLIPSTEAAIIIDFYKNILKQGSTKASAIMRYIASMAQSEETPPGQPHIKNSIID